MRCIVVCVESGRKSGEMGWQSSFRKTGWRPWCNVIIWRNVRMILEGREQCDIDHISMMRPASSSKIINYVGGQKGLNASIRRLYQDCTSIS
jgi:hypothetical protein